MFKSIITRYHGPTNHNGSRISASAEGVPRLYMPYDYGLNAAENQAAAAAALANRHEWLKDGMQLTGGVLPNGRGYAFVFTTTNAADNQYRVN